MHGQNHIKYETLFHFRKAGDGTAYPDIYVFTFSLKISRRDFLKEETAALFLINKENMSYKSKTFCYNGLRLITDM